MAGASSDNLPAPALLRMGNATTSGQLLPLRFRIQKGPNQILGQSSIVLYQNGLNRSIDA